MTFPPILMKLGLNIVLWFLFIFTSSWELYATNDDVTSVTTFGAKIGNKRGYLPHKLSKSESNSAKLHNWRRCLMFIKTSVPVCGIAI